MGCENKDGILEGRFRDYAWKYFQLHAEQRLKAFQFYITLSTAISGGLILLLRFGTQNKWISIFGFLLMFLSFIFWKLDCRTKGLIQNGENALSHLDSIHELEEIDGAPHPLQLFDRDDHYTKDLPRWPLGEGHFSYSRCFNWMFMLVGLIGGGFAIFALLKYPS